MKTHNGFTVETEVWHSAGFYRPFNKIIEKRDKFMTDSFNVVDCSFVVNRASANMVDEQKELVEITFGPKVNLSEDKLVTVRCTPNQEFLTCYENNGTLHYKGNETFFWVKAKDLKDGRRLVAEDANIVVKNVKILNEKDDIYSVSLYEMDKNFSIRLGVIVKGE